MSRFLQLKSTEKNKLKTMPLHLQQHSTLTFA